MSNIHIADMQHMTKSWNESVDTIGDSLRQAQDFAYCLGYNRAMDKVDELKSHLRLLAEAVLEAHSADALTDLEGNGNWVPELIGCQCEACRVAREVLK